jgi:hypothetical protein
LVLERPRRYDIIYNVKLIVDSDSSAVDYTAVVHQLLHEYNIDHHHGDDGSTLIHNHDGPPNHRHVNDITTYVNYGTTDDDYYHVNYGAADHNHPARD